jgi:hypothetical protein
LTCTLRYRRVCRKMPHSQRKRATCYKVACRLAGPIKKKPGPDQLRASLVHFSSDWYDADASRGGMEECHMKPHINESEPPDYSPPLPFSWVMQSSGVSE